MAAEDILTGVESVLDDSSGDVFAPVVRHPATPHVVRRSRRWTLAGVVDVSCLAGVDIPIVGTTRPAPTGTGHAVQRFSHSVPGGSSVLSREQRSPIVVVGHIVAMILDVVLDEPGRFLADSVPPSSRVVIFERCSGLRTVNEVRTPRV